MATAISRVESVLEKQPLIVDVINCSTSQCKTVNRSINNTRMPQQSAPRGTAEEEAAALPLPVSSPSFSIPPHLLGRNVDNPAEDTTAHGRKLQKPRLGVRVPYRNLTSQIVTQEELAKELLERSLKKYPVHDTPEGGDIFFTIKLAQRLAHSISSVQSSSGLNIMESNVQQGIGQKSNNVTPSKQSQEPKSIADDNELLAILEGDADPNWIPGKTNTTPECTKSPIKATVYKDSPTPTKLDRPTPTKLDPVLERELALKQLMEFQTTPRKKKSDKVPEKTVRKVKAKVKLQQKNLTENNASGGTKHDSNATKESNEAFVDVKKYSNGKRKHSSASTNNCKKRKIEHGTDNQKTDSAKVLKLKSSDKKKVNYAKNNNEFNSNSVQHLPNNSFPVEDRPATISLKPKKENLPPSKISANVSSNEIKISSETNSSLKSKADTEINQTHLNAEVICINEVSKEIKPGTLLKTYSPKKKVDGDTDADVPAITSDSFVNKSLPKTVDGVPNVKKRVRLTEVDLLLIDEGAINLLYEAEQGESKRRSAISEVDPNLNSSLKRVIKPQLKSTRRKKKDLLLKTRLVKNAVFRLKATQMPSVPNLRMKKKIFTPPITKLLTKSTSKTIRPVESEDFIPSVPIPPTDCQLLSPSFSYPSKPHLRAEASRIIRRHSSSSNFSSRSTSPSPVVKINVENSFSPDNSDVSSFQKKLSPVGSLEKAIGKPGVPVRKKGVPIFVRKVEPTQTYKGKKKKKDEFVNQNNIVSSVCTLESEPSDIKVVTKVKNVNQKVGFDSKKLKTTEKMKGKEIVNKTSSKDIQRGKQKLVKLPAESVIVKVKKRFEVKDKLKKSEGPILTQVLLPNIVTDINSGGDDVAELTSCLAEAASAFAAEDKTYFSPSISLQNSDCEIIEFVQPQPATKKESSRAAPQSPNAASYSNLLKSLDNDSQKQRKKDGEENQKQRSSVRQNAGTFNYREISMRRHDGLVQIIMNPASTKMKNALNLQVLRELRDALYQIRRDDSCRAVLLTSTGSSFCQGIDLHCLLHVSAERRKTTAQEFSQAIKDFIRTLAHFNKPIVAGVNGAAVGLGVAMLPFFDMVIASDKATFYTPYAKLGQVPEGAATLSFPLMFGNSATSELLYGCRKVTASEALNFGLVTRILWPNKFQEELLPIIRGVSIQSPQAMEAMKALLRHSIRTKLDIALESETHLLVQHWSSIECQANMRRFLEQEEELGLQRQRLDPDV